MFRSASNREPKSACPTEQELVGLLNGSGVDAQQALEAHIESCVSCQERLDLLTEPVADETLSSQQKRLWNKVFEAAGKRSGSSHAFLNSALSSRPQTAERAEDDEACVAHVPSIPGYEFRERIAVGAMGSVYRAWHPKLGRDVAIKLLRSSPDQRRFARFEQEMKAVGRLSDSHIVHAYDAGEAEGIPYIVMELVDGCDLSEYVRSSSLSHQSPGQASLSSTDAVTLEADGMRLSVEEACDCVCQAAIGLQAAHDAGVVHRDVKPSNLMKTTDGVVKILDLGLAAFQLPTEDSQRAHDEACIIGSLDYLAPEQARDAMCADARSDVYGLGCTLFTLLAGQTPFPSDEYPQASQKLLAHATEQRPEVKDRNPAVPSKLSALVARMMNIDPSLRPQTADEVEKLLRPFADKKRRWSPATRVGVAAVVTGLLIFGAVVIKAVVIDAVAKSDPSPTPNIDLSSIAASEAFPDRIRTLSGLPLPSTGFCFGPSGNDAFTLSYPGEILRWNLESGESTPILSFQSERVSKTATVTPDGSRLYFANSNGLTKFNLETRSPDWTVEGSRNLWVQLLPNSNTILHGRQRKIFVRDASDGSEVRRFPIASDQLPSITADGTRIAFRDRRKPDCVIFHPSEPWDADAATRFHVAGFEPTEVQFSPDEQHLIAIGTSETVIWNIASGEIAERYHTPNHRQQSLLIPVATTNLFLTLRGDLRNELILWDPMSNKVHRSISIPSASSLSVSRDGRRVLTSDFATNRDIYGGDIHLWKLAD